MEARDTMATFVVYKDNAKQYRWRMKASNGLIVADSSEGYVNKSDCLAGIDIVKKEAPNAKIEDTTASAMGRGY